MFVCGLPMLVACGKHTLTTPTNCAVDQETFVITWQQVENAEYYHVEINGQIYQSTTTSFPAESILSKGGKYSIRVKALDREQQFLDSEFSSTVVVENMLPLPTPVLTLDGVNLSWQCEGAEYYCLVINGVKFDTTQTSVNLAELSQGDELFSAIHYGYENSFRVYAKATSNNAKSELSNEVKCVVTSPQQAPQNLVVQKEAGRVVLTFDPVDTATTYTIKVNNQTFQTDQTEVDITYFISGFGPYQVSARCNKVMVQNPDLTWTTSYMESPYSTVATYENKPDFVSQQVAGVSIDSDGILTFDAVQDATEYAILVNGVEVTTTTENLFNLSVLSLSAGNYYVSVIAQTLDYKSLPSNVANFKVQARLSTPVANIIEQNAFRYVNIEPVQFATGYKIQINGYILTTANTLYEVSNYLTVGNNTIIVTALGDNDLYLNSPDTQITYTHQVTLEQVSNFTAYANEGKYYVQFDGVVGAEQYVLTINNSQNVQVLQQQIDASQLVQNTAIVDIDSAITSTDTFTFKVVASSSQQGYISSQTSFEQELQIFDAAAFGQKTFFYNGNNYTYCINSQQQLEDFVFYAVMYRLQNVQVFINFDYQNIENAYSSATSVLDNLLPRLSKYGVDVSQNNVLAQLFSTSNLSKLPEIIELIERTHDQMFLYYDVSSILTSQKSNRVYTLNFEYNGDYEAASENALSPSEQVDLPVNYTIQNSGRTFAIDAKTAVPVETVSQLLMAVQYGAKPEFVATSKTAGQLVDNKTIAERTYLKAREVLAQICTDSMTDYQKALAIYDWIVTHNQYDNSTYESASGTPFSWDNLSEMSFYASGMLLNGKAVCKGIAQAFALMCNIEGIKTFETFGLVGGSIDWSAVDFNNMYSLLPLINNIADIGGHSWNRIYLDAGAGDQWYIVDGTWADLTYQNKEYLSHNYFLTNDSNVANQRKELYPCGTYYTPKDQNGNDLDCSANGSFDYYKQTSTYIASQLSFDSAIAQLLQSNYAGIELFVDESIVDNCWNMLDVALTNNGQVSANFDKILFGNYLFVTKK